MHVIHIFVNNSFMHMVIFLKHFSDLAIFYQNVITRFSVKTIDVLTIDCKLTFRHAYIQLITMDRTKSPLFLFSFSIISFIGMYITIWKKSSVATSVSSILLSSCYLPSLWDVDLLSESPVQHFTAK